MTKAQRVAEERLKHGYALLRIFPGASKLYANSPISLYERLHRLEAEAHSFAERCCNEDIPEDKQARKDKSILDRLDAILGFRASGIPVFLNGDPRGYAIKIDDAYVKANNLDIHRDWGGYGIVCPEF